MAVILGNYPPKTGRQFISTPLESLSSLATYVDHVMGCSDMFCSKYDANAVKQSAAAADLVVVCLGTGKLVKQSVCAL